MGMGMPVRTLPVLENWDCQGCTDCCREYLVRVTEEERQRIEQQGWENDPHLQGVSPFQWKGWFGKRRAFLNQHKDGACVFLAEDGRCQIHAKFGAVAKPLACRVYPFMLVPTGDHWRVGLRYSCPSASRGEGRPLAEHLPDLRVYVKGLEQQEAIDPSTLPGPPTHRLQSMNWSDFFRVIRVLSDLLGDTRIPVERRLRRCLALAAMCREARFDKVTGGRLAEFLQLLTEAVDAEVPADPEHVEPPSWIGRILFRQTAAIFLRKDTGPQRGLSRHGRLALFWAAWKFARGRGRIPRLHASLPEIDFAQLEQPAGPLPTASEQLLGRYYQLKVQSIQFCGPTNFQLPLWDGLAALVLTYPAIQWLRRAWTMLEPEEAVRRAVRIVDDNFGFNPLFKSSRNRFALQILASRRELDRLVAWYAR